MQVTRSDIFLRPDFSRVLLRPFLPGDMERMQRIVCRILLIPESLVGQVLEEVARNFIDRHEHLFQSFRTRFEQLREMLLTDEPVTEQRQLLIGAYFMAEYSLEASALFNPSIVPHPDQSGLPPGSLRFILSLRATGEGHISSITFRTGTLDVNCHVEVDEADDFLAEPLQSPNPLYEKPQFARKLSELEIRSEYARRVLGELENSFTLTQLEKHLQAELERSRALSTTTTNDDEEAAKGIRLLALSNHEVRFQPTQSLSERIIFPTTPSQRNGIEDARFVCFEEKGDDRVYYATFTAYDGRVIVPQLVQTTDFLLFRFITLNGPAAENKGMALFPRKINGLYAMLSRQDNENIYLMFSEDIYY